MITEIDIQNMFGRHKLDDDSRQKVDIISARYEQLAMEILDATNSDAEQTVAIRKLMEAKQQTVFAIVKSLPLVD